MPQVKKEINGQEFTFGVIPIGIARKMNGLYPDQSDFNVAFIAESLRAGGREDADMAYVDSLPFYGGSFEQLLSGAFDANGLKLEKKKPASGEGEPANDETPALEAAPAMASTSDTSTEA